MVSVALLLVQYNTLASVALTNIALLELQKNSGRMGRDHPDSVLNPANHRFVSHTHRPPTTDRS